jgi:hypothetical protein
MAKGTLEMEMLLRQPLICLFGGIYGKAKGAWGICDGIGIRGCGIG